MKKVVLTFFPSGSRREEIPTYSIRLINANVASIDMRSSELAQLSAFKLRTHVVLLHDSDDIHQPQVAVLAEYGGEIEFALFAFHERSFEGGRFFF